MTQRRELIQNQKATVKKKKRPKILKGHFLCRLMKRNRLFVELIFLAMVGNMTQ